MSTESDIKKPSIAVWLQAGRIWSAPATIVSVFAGAALALNLDGSVKWWLLPIVAICGFLYHFAANIHSDVFDFKKQVDKNYTFGGSGVLTGGLLTPELAYKGGWVIFAFASALGLILVYYRGLPMLALGIAGLLGAYFYCANPVGYKYYGLGDIGVFLFFGTLMTVGSFLALTGAFTWQSVFVSIPLGSLIAGILSANNVRDIKHDTEAGIKTFESMLGTKGGIFVYGAFIVIAYLSIVLMVVFRIVPVWTLAVFLSVPLALKALKTVSQGDFDHPERLAGADVMTAQLHTAFGALLILSIAAGALV